MRATCPTRPSRNPPAVSSNLYPSTVLEIPVTLMINGQITETLALIDLGAAGNFIDASFAKTHNISLVLCVTHLAVAALDGRPLGSSRVQFITEDIQLHVGVLHTESIKLFVFQSPQTPIILGLPWLACRDRKTQSFYFLVRKTNYSVVRILPTELPPFYLSQRGDVHAQITTPCRIPRSRRGLQ